MATSAVNLESQARYLVGVDIGTGGPKAVLVDADGRVIATTSRRSSLYQPSPGIVEEDPEFQFQMVCECVAELLNTDAARRVGAGANLAAIGVSGQMAGVIGIGADGRNVTPYDSWLDTRCAPYIAQMRDVAGDEIIRKTGGPPSFNHGPKILWWKSERSEIFAKIAAFVQPSGYVAMRLCELTASQAFIDRSYLHFSGFADNSNHRWDDELCRKFDVPMEKLPRIVESREVVGTLSAAVATQCGTVAGVPVIAGCGDTAASFLAAGATRVGICVDVAGTASVFAATTDQFRADVKYGTLGWGCSAVPGLWYPYAYINGGGMNIEWFAKEFADAATSGDVATFDRLNAQASQWTPTLEDPIFLPHLSGRVSPAEPQLRGVWAGLTWTHTKGHLYRAVLEAVALEYCIYRDVLAELNPELAIRELRLTGGGEKSALWNQIKSDALGMRSVRVDRSEGGPLGVAMLAGYGVGLFDSIDETASRWIAPGEAYEPNRAMADHYAKRLERYRELLKLMNRWYTQS